MSEQEKTPISDFYAKDPIKADQQVFGRKSHADRRGFLRGAGLAALGAALGSGMVFHRNFPAGLIPQPWPMPAWFPARTGW
ncbi:hypothetical protein JCM17843_07290 [Kordiimonadales bacterium JCM 17843]|nr:hypothetical protein JCM17843_07290 [Kordiimonadales bacterium JCM 17843]